MVSHELRTPLSLIVGLSEIVLRERHDPAGAALRDIEQINISRIHTWLFVLNHSNEEVQVQLPNDRFPAPPF